MTKNHYIQIAVMSLVILIASVLFGYYYENYVAPESYTIGSLSGGDYKELAIKDYLSDETVLFSQNINDVSFKVENGTATYDYNFDMKDFNGLENNYLIYVNNYIINNLTTNAGVISGTYNLNYQDVNNDTLCASNINISFTFRSLSSVLRVTLPANDLGYLMNYFKSDNFIITLALSPFEFGNKDGEVDEKVNQIIELTNQVNSLSGQINTLNGQITEYIQQIADLTNAGEDKAEQIAELQGNISTLQSQISSLNSQLSEKSEELNTIQTENAELLEENASLSALVTSQQETITSLNQTISELQYQVSYYQQLLEAYENSNKLIVTFKVDDSAHSVQVVDQNEFSSNPPNPAKAGYEFIGWSLNGTDIVDVTTISITQNTTFIAIFRQYQVSIKTWFGLTSFMGFGVWTDGENIYYSQKNEQYVLDKETSTWNVKTWNGLSNFSGERIWSDGENIYYSHYTSQYILNKETSTWYEKSWNVNPFSGIYIWTDNENIYYSNDTEQYVLDPATSTWELKSWNGLNDFDGYRVWTDGENFYYSYFSATSLIHQTTKQYILNKETSTWTELEWNGLNNIDGDDIWTDGENIYYSYYNSNSTFTLSYQYVLDVKSQTWEEVEWSLYDDLYGNNIWSDGENIYCSVYDKQYFINY